MGKVTDVETIDRYRLTRLLGDGGMGQVYLATARGAAGFEKVVALKVLGVCDQGNSTLALSLLREAMIGVRLEHENVVQVLDCGEDRGRYFVAMEYIRGFTLGHVIRHVGRGGMPIAVAAHVARTVAGALDFVHRFVELDGTPLGLIHGDVSPSNVLLAADGRIKLADFGVAALAQETSGRGMLTGKLSYLPREAYRGEPAAQSWDVYALGAVLYEMLAGERAFAGKDVESIQAALARGATPLGELQPSCGGALEDVVTRAIAHEPAERFATAAEFRDALDAAWPRALGDAEASRAFVESVYVDASFIAANGSVAPTPQPLLVSVPRLAEQMDTVPGVRFTPSQGLRFGLSPARGVERARAAGERLAEYLSARLGCAVRATVFGDYQSLVDAAATGEVDLAWMPPVAFLVAHDRAVSALAIVERHGHASYESAIFVRADSPLRGLADLRGKSIAWVDQSSASGYVFAAAELVRVLGRLDGALGRQHYFGSHREVCEAVLNGWCEAGATYAVREGDRVVQAGWLDALGERAAGVRPIAFSVPIPGDAIACRPGLPQRIRADVEAALLATRDDVEGQSLLSDVFGADGFAPSDGSTHETLRARLRLL